MAEALLGVAVEVTVSKVIAIVGEQISLAWGFKDELQELCTTLEMMNAFLQDADQKKLDPPVKLWLQGLAEVASDADDLLEDIRYESLRRQVEVRNKLRKKVSNFFSGHNPVAFRLKMANRIKDINASFTKKNMKASELGLQERVPPQAEAAHASQIEESHSSIGDTQRVVGREADCSKVIDLLIKSSTNGLPLELRVVTVVGMPGLGKTTLAKLVFNDERSKSHFDATIWVCVSETFDVKVILKHALECLTDENVASFQTKEKILTKLGEKLANKRYLLVLDDVWNKDIKKWTELLEDLSGISRKATECAILATTRDMEVATTMGSPMEFTYALATVEDEGCWSIIKETCYGIASSSHHVLPNNLEKIGRDIARKCEGLPLLAKVIGGILRKDKSDQAWASIQENVLSHSLGSNSDQRVIQALQLSFDRLSSPCLKKCFAFCSIFQDDQLFLKQDLIQLWMASGFIHPSAPDTQWSIGNQYFNDLVSNCLFQDIERDFYGNIIACKMHDMVHNFTKSLSRATILSCNGGVPSDVSHICHLNLEGKETHLAQTLNLFSRQNLRSLFARFNIFRYNGLEFTRLRILSFGESEADIKELPSSIGNLKCLTYFDISLTAIKELPRSFTTLYNLETLKLLYCSLEKLPDRMDNLVNLTHLIFDMEELMPMNIGRLTCLQTLPIFVVRSETGYGIEELGSLARLQGKLEISKLELVGGEEEARMAKLDEKSEIFELVLAWGSCRGNNEHDEAVLEGLQPNPNLKGLKIIKYEGHKFTTWISSESLLCNLMKLELRSCNSCVKLPSLGRLPKLICLGISGLNNIRSLNEDFFCNGNFPSLKTLDLWDMQSLEELMEVEPKVTFPSLEKLEFHGCPKLKGIPWTDGLPSLKWLDISFCPQLSYLKDGLSSFMQLKRLDISYCSNLKSIPSPWGASSLEDLTIIGCGEVRSASRLENGSCSSLKHLRVRCCPVMNSEVEQMSGRFSCLKSLSIDVISSSSDDVWEFGEFSTSLESLELNGYEGGENIKSLVKYHIPELTSLKYLKISNFSSLEDLPELHSLQELHIESCPDLKNVQCCSRMLKLKVMKITATYDEVEFPPYFDSIFHLSSHSLEELALDGCTSWTCLPSQLRNLTCLKKLEIWRFEEMEALPEWIGDLSSLESLELCNCSNLMHMPSHHSMQRLSKLKSLYIFECPKLEERCEMHIGPEWFKISHIPNILI